MNMTLQEFDFFARGLCKQINLEAIGVPADGIELIQARLIRYIEIQSTSIGATLGVMFERANTNPSARKIALEEVFRDINSAVDKAVAKLRAKPPEGTTT